MVLWDWFFQRQRSKKRTDLLQRAKAWPTVKAKLLAGKQIDKDELAEGTSAQDWQIEFPFYFTLNAGYFGGHVRTLPCSAGEARRLEKQMPEGTEITARYNPANPDEVCVLASDNVDAPIALWQS